MKSKDVSKSFFKGGADVDLSRRQLLAGAAVIGLAGVVGVSLDPQTDLSKAMASENATSVQHDTGSSDVQYGFMVRTGKCTNCQECVKACREVHGTPSAAKGRRKVTQYDIEGKGTYYISTSCMHCEHPACAEVCPAGAISKGDGGIVVVDQDRCIGCKYCYQACPFSVPTYTSAGMDKCDACLSVGVELGQDPYCVKACKFRALHYGTLDELRKAASDAVWSIDSSTGPSFLFQ